MALHHQLAASVAALFPQPGQPRTRRIGVEQELIARDAYDGSAPAIDRIRQAARGASYEPFLGFEPGGQVELSLPAVGSVSALDRYCREQLGRVHADCAAAGIELDDAPVDVCRDVHEVPLQLCRPRYLGMQQHFDRLGPQGRRMMRLTASTQLCLDWWPGEVGLEQWRVLNLSGPALAALFARGPVSRTGIWLGVDPGRTAFDDRLLDDDPVAAYVDFALGAIPFALPEGGRRAAAEHHLSTLFPPVRPRGSYLEVRFLDAQPADRIAPIAATLAALLYDDTARRTALALLASGDPLAEKWQRAAIRHPDLVDEGRALVALSLPHERRLQETAS